MPGLRIILLRLICVFVYINGVFLFIVKQYWVEWTYHDFLICSSLVCIWVVCSLGNLNGTAMHILVHVLFGEHTDHFFQLSIAA